MTTTSTELEELIDGTVTIPTIPSTLAEINRVFASEDGSVREAGDVIDKDPAIAAKVLRLVNSSLYGLRNPVNAIGPACSILGLKVIRNVVLQATVLDSFPGSTEKVALDLAWLWDHSFKTATAARLLAQAVPKGFGLDKNDAYTCGLVHDIGKIVLVESQPDRFAEALALSRAKQIPLARAEVDVYCFTHAHVGGVLAKRWGLSESLQEAVMFHHTPGGSPEEWAKGFLIQCANTIAHEAARTNGGYNGDCVNADSFAVLGLDDEVIDDIRAEVREATADTN